MKVKVVYCWVEDAEKKLNEVLKELEQATITEIHTAGFPSYTEDMADWICVLIFYEEKTETSKQVV